MDAQPGAQPPTDDRRLGVAAQPAAPTAACIDLEASAALKPPGGPTPEASGPGSIAAGEAQAAEAVARTEAAEVHPTAGSNDAVGAGEGGPHPETNVTPMDVGPAEAPGVDEGAGAVGVASLQAPPAGVALMEAELEGARGGGGGSGGELSAPAADLPAAPAAAAPTAPVAAAAAAAASAASPPLDSGSTYPGAGSGTETGQQPAPSPSAPPAAPCAMPAAAPLVEGTAPSRAADPLAQSGPVPAAPPHAAGATGPAALPLAAPLSTPAGAQGAGGPAPAVLQPEGPAEEAAAPPPQSARATNPVQQPVACAQASPSGAVPADELQGGALVKAEQKPHAGAPPGPVGPAGAGVVKEEGKPGQDGGGAQDAKAEVKAEAEAKPPPPPPTRKRALVAEADPDLLQPRYSVRQTVQQALEQRAAAGAPPPGPLSLLGAAGVTARHPPGQPLLPVYVGTEKDYAIVREQFLWQEPPPQADASNVCMCE